MHIVSTMASHNFLQLEKVLDYNVMDVFAYLQYLEAKVSADNAQMKYSQELSKRKK